MKTGQFLTTYVSVHHFSPDLVLVKAEDNRRSRVITGAVYGLKEKATIFTHGKDEFMETELISKCRYFMFSFLYD